MRLFDCMAGVIRCRDCRFCGKREDRLLCMHPDCRSPHGCRPNGYCSDGERRRKKVGLLYELLVGVVHCEDCAWCEDMGMSGMYCNHPENRNPLGCRPTDYCDRGERKKQK